MKISVITVCYNAAAHIEGCLRSVAEQTFQNVEHVVVDGLSSDATVSIVGRYPHVAKLVSERDRGIYDAMNKGLDLVTGDFVLFLNADDRFASKASLAKAVAAIQSDPGGDVYYGSLEVRPLDGPSEIFHPPGPARAPELMICGCLPHQSTLTRPTVFSRTGRFDLRYRYHADYDWFLKILADPAIDVRSIREVVGSFRLGGVSSQLASGQHEVYAIQNQSPLFATSEWDKRRIEAFQQALLNERLATARLKDEIQAARKREQRLRDAFRVRGDGVTSIGGDFARSLPARVRAVADAVRSSPRRLRWRVLNACVRYLPAGVVDTLRRLRSRAVPTRRAPR